MQRAATQAMQRVAIEGCYTGNAEGCYTGDAEGCYRGLLHRQCRGLLHRRCKGRTAAAVMRLNKENLQEERKGLRAICNNKNVKWMEHNHIYIV